MSDEAGQDDFHVRLFLSEQKAARITPELVAKALEGFPLKPQRDMAWLVRAIQPAVFLSSQYIERTGNLKGHAATRDELKKLADRASTLWRDLFGMGDEQRAAIERLAWDRWDLSDAETQWENHKAELDAYREAVNKLYDLSVFLTKASAHVGGMKVNPKWRAASRHHWRVEFATCLTPAFEKGFGRKAAWNNRDYADGSRPQHWADFYQRMMALAFDEKATPNLETVLKEGRSRYPKNGELFTPGYFPE